MIPNDLDPLIKRAFDEAVGGIQSQPRRSPVRRRRTVAVRIATFFAAGALVVAAAGGGLLLGEWRSDRGSVATHGYERGSCRPTPVTLRYDVGTGWSPPIRLITGGALASWALGEGTAKRYMSPGDYWFIRDSQPRDSIQLRAERLDRTADPITFTARGYPLGGGFVREWSTANWYYRTSVEDLENLPSAGCWRVSLVGGHSEDSIVYALRAPGQP